MELINRLEDFPQESSPYVLSIGNFDGVHLGHQHLLQRLRTLANAEKGKVVLITFLNHPSEILFPEKPVEYICSLSHKLHLLKNHGVDCIVALTFSQKFSQKAPQDFLKNCCQYIPLTHLVLGSDAHFGRGREGSPKKVCAWAEQLGFQAEYLNKYFLEDTCISSTTIRQCIREKNFSKASLYLGRPYSMMGPVLKGEGRGHKMGFPTANLDVSNLCLPPFGTYCIEARCEGSSYFGVANLGIAPTVKNLSSPLLEAHLFKAPKNLYGKSLEVIPRHFLRSEKKFQNFHDLKNQISKDVKKAASYFS